MVVELLVIPEVYLVNSRLVGLQEILELLQVNLSTCTSNLYFLVTLHILDTLDISDLHYVGLLFFRYLEEPWNRNAIGIFGLEIRVHSFSEYLFHQDYLETDLIPATSGPLLELSDGQEVHFPLYFKVALESNSDELEVLLMHYGE